MCARTGRRRGLGRASARSLARGRGRTRRPIGSACREPATLPVSGGSAFSYTFRSAGNRPFRLKQLTSTAMGKDIELAILFADVVGSTKLYEQMGDIKARDMVAACIEIMRSATDAHSGTVIKTMGDEVMATFPTADDALNAASQMQHAISTHPELTVDGSPVAIRIGCHFGPVGLENRDVFGSAVRRSNRMTSQAKARQSNMSTTLP